MNDDLEELDSEPRMRHQRYEWRAERLGWAALAALLYSAAIGLLGPSAWNAREVQSADGTLSVAGHSVERRGCPAEIEFQLRPAMSPAAEIELFVPETLGGETTLESIEPSPLSGASDAAGTTYTFLAHADRADIRITYRFKYDRHGTFKHVFQSPLGERVEFHHLVWP